jgi:hypothetical protein
MKRVLLLLAAAFAAVLAAFLPRMAGAQTGPKGSVTIFTDGMTAPNGPMTRALTELSVAFDKGARKLRVLPIMGQGGESNVRDLLRFRGVDFAVVNADVLASSSLLKNLPEAPRKMRAVTKLRSQKAFLFARPEIQSVEQLAGAKIAVFGPEPMSKLTAETVFGLLKVKVTILYMEEGVNLGPPPEAQAVFLLEDEARRLLPAVVPEAEFRLIPIPHNAAVGKAYGAAAIQPAEASAYSGAEAIPTIAVDTLLATFDWGASQARFPDVSAFIDRLFGSLPELRRDYPGSIWQETDPAADVPGWQRYDYAEKVRLKLGANAAVAAATPATPTPRAAAGAAPAPAPGAPVRLSIVPYPPLTDQHAPAGGLIGELTIAAMERADPPHNRSISFLWEKDRLAQVRTVLADKSADIAVPLERAGCEDLRQTAGAAAPVCDGALASEPLFKVLVLYFIGANSDFSFASDDSLAGRTVCLPADRDEHVLGDAARKLVADGKLSLVRPGSLIECLDLVQRGDADAVLTNELEGRLTISRLGLSNAFRMADRAVGTQNIEIILAKDAPGAQQMLAALNKGIAKLKSDELYARIVAKHLAQINAGN